MAESRLRIEYLVSRFPRTSETFIVREIDALAKQSQCEIGIRSLFPSPDTKVHELAKPWVGKLIRPGGAQAGTALLWALLTRPRALFTVIGVVLSSYRGVAARVRALVAVLLAIAHARSLARSQARVHVHAHYATYPALGAWVCKQLVGTTYSFTAHAHDLYVDQSMLARKVEDAEFVVTISEFNRRFIHEVCPNSTTEVSVIHCGIDTSRYAFRSRQKAGAGEISALTIASLQEYKGHEYLLRAMASSSADSPVRRLTATLIGAGVLKDELAALAAELGISGRVNFAGSQTEDEVVRALEEADIFILPSVIAADGQMEGLPVALMESLAVGIPTVSTRISGIPELVEEGVTGYLAEPADPASLVRAIERAISDPDRESVAQAGRARIESEFELSECVGELKRCFENIGVPA